MSLHRERFALGLLAGAFLSACGAAPADYESSSVQAELGTVNGLRFNGLGSNGLNSNGLNSNGLNSNGLESLTDVREFKSWLGCSGSPRFAANIDTMDYLVSCALGASEIVTIHDACGKALRLQGGMGLAPAWRYRAPTEGEQESVSACLMSRVNARGQHVPLSFRQHGLQTAQWEMDSFPYVEGAFFGNLFSPVVSKFVCRADYANVTAGRSCAMYGPPCGFSGANGESPSCDNLCVKTVSSRGVVWWFGACLANGRVWDRAMTTGMAGYDVRF